MTLADKIVVLKDGQIMQAGAPMELYQEPANAFVAGFLGSPSMNFLPVEVRALEGDRALVASPSLPALEVRGRAPGLRSGASARLGIRPQHLDVLPEGASPPPNAAPVSGTVDLSERLGSETIMEVTLSDGERLVAALPRDATFLAGQTVTLLLRPDQAHLFTA
jgi:multiple sugar transport system ATP-binding protein